MLNLKLATGQELLNRAVEQLPHALQSEIDALTAFFSHPATRDILALYNKIYSNPVWSWKKCRFELAAHARKHNPQEQLSVHVLVVAMRALANPQLPAIVEYFSQQLGLRPDEVKLAVGLTALAHDLVEDTPNKHRQAMRQLLSDVFRTTFGWHTCLTADCIHAVDKLTDAVGLTGNVRREKQAETLRDLDLSRLADVMVALTKTADKLANPSSDILAIRELYQRSFPEGAAYAFTNLPSMLKFTEGSKAVIMPLSAAISRLPAGHPLQVSFDSIFVAAINEFEHIHAKLRGYMPKQLSVSPYEEPVPPRSLYQRTHSFLRHAVGETLTRLATRFHNLSL